MTQGAIGRVLGMCQYGIAAGGNADPGAERGVLRGLMGKRQCVIDVSTGDGSARYTLFLKTEAYLTQRFAVVQAGW